MKVADIFALLSVKSNKQSFDRSQGQLGKFVGDAERKVSRLAGVMKSQFAQLAGITAAVFATKNALDFEEAITRLGISADGKLGSLEKFSEKVLSVSDSTGIAKEALVQGAGSFIALTGDVETATGAVEIFAKVAQATGSDIDDVARSGAALSQSMGIAGEDFEKAFSILIASGKAGAVELKDVSQVMSKLSAVSSNFAGGKGIDALADTGAALQLVVRAYGGRAKEGANALEQLMGSLTRAEPKLKKFGVAVFDIDPATGKKTRRNFQNIIEDIAKSQLALDPTALQETLGSKEALAAFEQLTKVDGEWRSLADSTRDATDVADDYAKINRSAAVKVSKAWNRAKNSITRGIGIIIDAISWMSDRIEPVLVVLGSLAVAFAIVEARAVGAGLAAARAWLMAIAPIVLMGALIAAIILLIEDIWTSLNGGEGLFDGTWLEEIFIDAIEFWHEQLTAFFNWLEAKFTAVKDTLEKYGLWSHSELKQGKRLDVGKINALASANKNLRENALTSAAGDGNFFGAARLAGSQSAAIQNSLVVNIEAGANVDQDTIKNLVDQTQEAMARTARQIVSVVP